MKTIAIYPGSFDPLTNGHTDIIERALSLFDTVIVAILHNPNKTGLFTVEERKELIRQSLVEYEDRIEVDSFDGLLVDYAEKKGAKAIVRGMRAMGDFESEFQMAMMNRRLNREVQTVFLITGLRWIFTSSSVIKEAARFGADISGMVSPAVHLRLKEKMEQAGYIRRQP
ncbi:pantetheine-phosphate adenylyltransferase [Desulfobotulus sp.]|jgi:pantetheine-phosphate adenylyltransferase|uniref:pantetheine-phosphate adenylyltransferase n=1 Tax=Desulfobotulus sp. TaxID=1940337 RepID=UPI002A369AD7|nr:pantetheine-phosphate adenylyltransferase [Desulfobotulus sp.]MDY0164667.1 pantetheine-phosphate adenylyltransferase [Desulfobotulus sp.]